MDDFSFRRDLKYVEWKSTLVLNAVRAASAGGIVGTLLGLVFLFNPDGGSERLFGLVLPLVYAVMLPIGLPLYFAIAIVCGYLAELGVPFIGWLPLMMGLIFGLGDPVLFFLKRSRPDLVPVEQPAFFSPRVVLFVLDRTRMTADPQAV